MTKKMATSDPDRDPFPEEMVFEILKRLPVKSLCRFRCVSKRWFSIISDPDFVDANFAFSRPKLLISVLEYDFYSHDSYRPLGFFSVDFPEQGQGQQQPLQLHATSHRSIDIAPAAYISASPSGGLICFTCYDGIRIGNPITGEFDLIQTPVSKVLNESSSFGFDPIDKNHIILKLDWDRDYAPGLCGKSLVFSLNGKHCHEYDTPPHPWVMRDYAKSSVCINGIIYFTARSNLGDGILGRCLFAYEVRTKNFQMIHRPWKSVMDRTFEVELVIDYKGCLALVCFGNLYSPSSVDSSGDEVWMWILEETEKHTYKWRSFKSFVVPWRENLKRDGISPYAGFPNPGKRKVKPFCVTRRGELVLASTVVSGGLLYLFLYDIDTNTLRRFDVDGFHGRYRHGVVTLNFVMESLESLNGLTKKKEHKCSDKPDPVEET